MLLVTAVYITRCKPLLCIARPEWALERVFLGALVVASKYHNDEWYNNKSWAIASGVFSSRDVNLIEREMLDVLSYKLRVKEEDLLAHELPLISAFASCDLYVSPSACWDSEPALSDGEDGEVAVWSDTDSEPQSDDSRSTSSEDPISLLLLPQATFPSPSALRNPSAKPTPYPDTMMPLVITLPSS